MLASRIAREGLITQCFELIDFVATTFQKANWATQTLNSYNFRDESCPIAVVNQGTYLVCFLIYFFVAIPLFNKCCFRLPGYRTNIGIRYQRVPCNCKVCII